MGAGRAPGAALADDDDADVDVDGEPLPPGCGCGCGASNRGSAGCGHFTGVCPSAATGFAAEWEGRILDCAVDAATCAGAGAGEGAAACVDAPPVAAASAPALPAPAAAARAAAVGENGAWGRAPACVGGRLAAARAASSASAITDRRKSTMTVLDTRLYSCSMRMIQSAASARSFTTRARTVGSRLSGASSSACSLDTSRLISCCNTPKMCSLRCRTCSMWSCCMAALRERA